jgi:hypothetical protein
MQPHSNHSGTRPLSANSAARSSCRECRRASPSTTADARSGTRTTRPPARDRLPPHSCICGKAVAPPSPSSSMRLDTLETRRRQGRRASPIAWWRNRGRCGRRVPSSNPGSTPQRAGRGRLGERAACRPLRQPSDAAPGLLLLLEGGALIGGARAPRCAAASVRSGSPAGRRSLEAEARRQSIGGSPSAEPSLHRRRLHREVDVDRRGVEVLAACACAASRGL